MTQSAGTGHSGGGSRAGPGQSKVTNFRTFGISGPRPREPTFCPVCWREPTPLVRTDERVGPGYAFRRSAANSSLARPAQVLISLRGERRGERARLTLSSQADSQPDQLRPQARSCPWKLVDPGATATRRPSPCSTAEEQTARLPRIKCSGLGALLRGSTMRAPAHGSSRAETSSVPEWIGPGRKRGPHQPRGASVRARPHRRVLPTQPRHR